VANSNSLQALDRCESILGYQFKDRALLQAALTHASSASTRLESNARMEFLGDAILGLIVCQELYERFPHHLEGDLTKIKSSVVSRRSCAHVVRQLGVDKLMFLGKGVSGRTHLPMSLAAAVFEALIAAVYLDGGFEVTRDLVLRLMGPVIEEAADSQNQDNYKSQLQQYAQQAMSTSPVYELLDEQGPDHSKCFEVCVQVNGKRFKSAWGPSKKEAEQKAAFNALVELGILPERSEIS